MKRLIAALLVAGVLFATIWVLVAALPLTGPTAGSDPNVSGNAWDGMGLYGGP